MPEPKRNGERQEKLDAQALKELTEQAPVVKLLDMILEHAVKDKASDIHLEPFEEDFKVRCRIDGVLYDISSPPKSLALALTSRVKVMANLDVAETRLPQDGRIMTEINHKKIDLRVSTLPTIFGESVVLRVLDKSTVGLSLDELGLSDDMKRDLLRLINRPHGILLVTGPTGSGKTTTLYSCMKMVNRIESKIITAEDPVEYDLPGVIQVAVRPKIDLTFARCLRHILRQDPDIIMVGEIRDVETAEIAIQASLTGHLVFSTLHTNDAPGAVARLMDMGIEPFLITSTVDAVLGQRLIRKICSECKVEVKPSKEAELGDLKRMSRGKGCARCNNTGFKGRLGIFELLVMRDEIRSLVLERKPASVIREAARSLGMRTLREDGIIKINEGLTTEGEVLRETQAYI